MITAVLIAVAYLLTCAFIWIGPYFNSGLDYTVGSVSDTHVQAPRDIENPYLTAIRLAEVEAELAATTVETIDNTLTEQIKEGFASFFERIDNIRAYHYVWGHRQAELEEEWADWKQYQAALNAELLTHGNNYENNGENDVNGESDANGAMDANGLVLPPVSTRVPPAEEPYDFPLHEHFENMPFISFTYEEREFLVAVDEWHYEEIYFAIMRTVDTLLDEPGLNEANVQRALLEARENLEIDFPDDDKVQSIGFEIMSAFLSYNRVFDEAGAYVLRQNTLEEFVPVMMLRGQTIVARGDIVDEEALAILDSLGLLATDWTREIVPMLGIFIIVAVAMFACCWFIAYFRDKKAVGRIKESPKEDLLLFTIYVFVLVVLVAMHGMNYYLMPLLVFTTLVAMLVDIRSAVVLNLGMTIIGYFIVDGDIAYMMFFMLAGSLVCLFARFTTERTKIMMVALLVACFNFAISMAVSLVFVRGPAITDWTAFLIVGSFAALNGLLTVILAVGSLPLWEIVFGVVTPIKLLDLTNPTNPLMRRMTIEAPGTYHHSLIVANLAETAAYDIGANPHIARAGGYYHDIGKLKAPQYFVENTTGENPHDHLDPLTSTRMIVSHVAHGLTLAAQYRLPQFLRDIINEHHGTSLIKYFYGKAKKMSEALEGAPEIVESDYRYPYVVPQSRESAVVMLADMVEAAVRSMISSLKDAKEMRAFINQLIKERLTDGSLADSGLSIRDVDTIAESFFRVLKGMYHERIPYPKIEEAMERK